MNTWPPLLGTTPFGLMRFLVIPSAYLAIAAAYIVLSTLYFSGDLADVLSGDFRNLEDLARTEVSKGLGFVLVTALLLALILHVETRRRQAVEIPFQRLVQSMADAVLIVRVSDNVIVYANPAAHTIFGYGENELVGQSTQAIHVAEDQRRSFLQAAEEMLSRGQTYYAEFQLRRKDGTLFATEHAVSTFNEATSTEFLVSVIRDMSGNKEMVERLRESKERFRQIAENISEVFWISDPEKNEMIYVSPAYEEIWGRSVASIYADPRSFIESIHPEDRERVVQAIERQSSGAYMETYRIIRPDGAVRWVRDRGSHVRNAEGEVYRIVGAADDITEEVDRERQLAHSARLTSMGEMAASLAHEINQPLAVINMASENAAMELETGEPDLAYVEERLHAVVEQVGKLRDLIDHMRTFARKDDGSFGAFDPADSIRGAVKLVEHNFAQAGIVLDVKFLEASPTVHGLPIRLEQALINILTNARDAILEKTARAPDAPRAIHVDCSTDGNALRIAVSDTGGGMPDDVRANLFEPFFTTKKGDKGTGLGMPIALSNITSLGGTIDAENVGEGCRITLSLPTLQSESLP